MAEPILLLCPFCGSEMMFRAALWPSEGDRDGVIHSAPTDCPLIAFEDGSADESIIERWNTRAQLDAAIATLDDEEAAHQDTLRLWQEAKAQLARAEKVIEVARRYCSAFPTCLPQIEAALDEYDRPSAPLDGS